MLLSTAISRAEKYYRRYEQYCQKKKKKMSSRFRMFPKDSKRFGSFVARSCTAFNVLISWKIMKYLHGKKRTYVLYL